MTPENVADIQKWFSDYCRSFDSDDEEFNRNIRLKEDHTYHVCSNILKIGGGESLDTDGMLIAEAAALLHDVGRFEQYRQYGTFRDGVSVNHGELGASIVEDYEVLTPLYPRERQIIAQSVEFHNAFDIPGKLPEETQFFLRMIRDADKLDVWRVFSEYFRQPVHERASAAGLGLPDSPKCSPAVLERISNGELVRLSSVKSLNDYKVMLLSWIYDLNFRTSFNLLAERGHIAGLASTLPADDGVAGAIEAILDFVGDRMVRTDACLAEQP